MPIQIGQKPSPTFQEPLELLSDCHRRIESFLQALILVAEQANGGALKELQREALGTALRYFREAAPKHTADEEESLFTRMREVNDDVIRAALAKIDALEADHEVAKRAHDEVEELGQKWLAVGTLSGDDSARFVALLRELKSIYQRHIAVEDNEIFPLARAVLTSAALHDVGREMAERRGQNASWLAHVPKRRSH
jgi:hemerythrin-like domain-containing protein